jgi:hypothetical protein
VASEKGLVTPVIRDVASLSLSGLSAKIKDAVARANQGKLSTADLQGGTLTVSNLGMFGVEEFDAIINPPQAGILAVGAAVRTPVVGEGDSVEIASVLSLVLSVNHRGPTTARTGPCWSPGSGSCWKTRCRSWCDAPIRPAGPRTPRGCVVHCNARHPCVRPDPGRAGRDPPRPGRAAAFAQRWDVPLRAVESGPGALAAVPAVLARFVPIAELALVVDGTPMTYRDGDVHAAVRRHCRPPGPRPAP